MSDRRDRILGGVDQAVRRNSDKVLEDRVTRSRVADAAAELELGCRREIPLRDAADFIPNVRLIMTAKKWDVAAWFQTIWVNTYENTLVGSFKQGRGSKEPLRIVDGSMDWLLKFDRARKVFDEVTKPSVFANDA